MALVEHSPSPSSEDLEMAAALLAGLSRCDLERLAAPLRPAVAMGEAGSATLVLLELLDRELAQRDGPS